MERKKEKQLTAFPLALAYCHASRLMRPFAQRKPTFLAILVVKVENMAGHFESAVEVLLQGAVRFGVRRANDQILVTTIKAGKAARDQIAGAAQGGDRQVVLIFHEEQHVPREYRDAADIYEVIEEFDAGLFAAAIYRVCGTVVSKTDAEYARGVSIDRLSAAFRKGRSARRSFQLLRRADMNAKLQQDEVRAEQDLPIRVEDLIGYGEAKVWGLKLLDDLKQFQAGRIAWRDVDPGVLLSGPTGTGKTRFARALANSAGLPLIQASAAQWQSAGHLGDLLREARETFRQAAENAPVILLLDEMDSFGDRTKITGEYADYHRQVVNGVLELMDGAMSRAGVVLVGTTNFPEHVDRALLRPGRMDRHIRMSAPNEADRVAILGQRLEIDILGDVAQKVASLTDGWTGAQLEQLARHTRRRARGLDRAPVANDIVAAMPASVVLSENRLHASALHECGHAIVGLAFGRKIELIKIVDRYLKDLDQVSLGSVTFRLASDTRRDLDFYLSEISVLFGGIAAESEVLGAHDDGSGGIEGSDLTRATRYATMIESSFGMGKTLISETESDLALATLRLQDGALWERIDSLLDSQMQQTREIIRRNRSALDDLVAAIVKRKKMTGDELAAFLEKAGHRIALVGDNPRCHTRGISP